MVTKLSGIQLDSFLITTLVHVTRIIARVLITLKEMMPVLAYSSKLCNSCLQHS